MNTCLYECRVRHQRFSPAPHRLDIPIFMFYVDLDELDGLSRKIHFMSRNSFNLYSFRDADHFKNSKQDLKSEITEFLRTNGISAEIGRIMLLTHLRFLGHVFNPVSFYFCFDAAGRPLAAIAEVSNTFGEMKPYFIPPADAGRFQKRTKKLFYVSPFMDLDLDFDFDLREPAETIDIYIDDIKGSERVLTSSLTGSKRSLENGRLFWYTFKYPFITLKVIALIHWHAFLLWAKMIPHHKKDSEQDLQKDILNPRRT